MEVTRQKYQDEVKKYWSERCNKLQAENAKLLDTIRNALTSLAIINMPIMTPDVATDKELMDIMAESFKQALKEAEKE